MFPCAKSWWLGLIAPCIACLAFMCSFIYSFWCQSIKFSGIDGYDNDVLLGPWYMKDMDDVENSDSSGNIVSNNADSYLPGVTGSTYGAANSNNNACTSFPDDVNIDAKWKTVRAFSIMTPLIGGLLIFVLVLNNCFYRIPESQWKTIAMIFSVILTLFQGLTFLLLQSNACNDNPLQYDVPPDITTNAWIEIVNNTYKTDCEWSDGSTTNIISIVCWFLTGIIMLIIGPPKRLPTPPIETQQVTYEKTINPDGTTTIAQTKVVKGTAVPSQSPPQPQEQA